MRIKAVIANEEKSKKMKKRTKISLRTKIYLTLVGLLALTGVLYAANPMFLYRSRAEATGVAASPDLICS